MQRLFLHLLYTCTSIHWKLSSKKNLDSQSDMNKIIKLMLKCYLLNEYYSFFSMHKKEIYESFIITFNLMLCDQKKVFISSISHLIQIEHFYSFRYRNIEMFVLDLNARFRNGSSQWYVVVYVYPKIIQKRTVRWTEKNKVNFLRVHFKAIQIKAVTKMMNTQINNFNPATVIQRCISAGENEKYKHVSHGMKNYIFQKYQK